MAVKAVKAVKPEKITEVTVEILLEKLESVGGISIKKMYGGHGFFHEGKMFGILDSKGKIFMKSDEANKSEFIVLGGGKESKMPYFSIPVSIVNKPKSLILIVKKSIELSK